MQNEQQIQSFEVGKSLAYPKKWEKALVAGKVEARGREEFK